MIIKEKRWLSRLVAMLCVLTMVVGVLTPASVGRAAACKSLVMNVLADVEYGDEDNDGGNMKAYLEDNDVAEDGVVSTDTGNYKYKYVDGSKNKIKIEPGEGKTSLSTVTFYLKTSDEPSVDVISGTGNVDVTNIGDGNWEVIVRLAKNCAESAEIEIGKKYAVTYSVGEGCNVTDGDKSIAGQTISYKNGQAVNFKATLDAGLEDSKKLSVKVLNVDGTTAVDKLISGANNMYKISALTGNRKVVVSAENITCKVKKPDKVPGGYTCSMEEDAEVVPGNDYNFYVIPEEGYKLPKVTTVNEVAKVTYLGNNLYIINKVTEEMQIKIEPGGKYTYDVIASEGAGYNIKFDDSEEKVMSGVEYGREVSFTVEADTGYDITMVTANGTVLKSTSDDNSKQYSTTITENTTISVTVKKQLCNVSYIIEKPDAYKLTKGIEGNVEFGSTCTFYVVPNPGYNAPTVEVNNKKLEPVNGTEYVTTITEKTTIKIIGNSLKEHNIKYSLVDGCEIYGEPVNKVTHGTELNFRLKVVKAYNQSVPVASVDGMTYKGSYSQSSDDESKIYSFTIPNITSDQIVLVSGIQKNTYTVTLKDGTGYSITTTETTSVSAGSIFRFKVNKKDGYQGNIVVQITGTDNEATYEATYNEDADYYSVAVNDNITISVESLTKATYNYKLTGEHVSIKNVDGETDVERVEHGGSLKFKVNPDDYYQVIQVAINGEPKTAVNEIYTVNNVTDTVDITVTTRANVLTVNYVDEKYNKSKTVRYSVDYTGNGDDYVEKTTGKVNLMESLATSKLYKPNGWLDDNGNEKSSLTIDKEKDTEVTLTAKWVLDIDKIKENIILTTDASWGNGEGEYQYTIRFRTYFNKENESESNRGLDEEYLKNIKITGVGTLYSNINIDAKSESTDKYETQIKNRHTSSSEPANDLLKQNISGFKGQVIYSFYKDYSSENAKDATSLTNGDYISLRLGSNVKNIQRFGLGWVELTINGEKVILFSKNAAELK